MSKLLNTLNIVFAGKLECCCLCLKTVDNESFSLKDKIILDETTNSIEIIEILSFLLHGECLNRNYAICKPCTLSAINSYKFIKMCKSNCVQMNKVVTSLNESLCSSRTSSPDYNSLFLFLKDDTCEFYYDYKQPITTKTKVLTRFKNLIKRKAKCNFEETFDYEDDMYLTSKTFESETKQDKPEKKKRKATKSISRVVTKIPTSDMTADRNSFKCKTCFKVFPSSQHLRQHYFRLHAAKKFKCPECPRHYGSQGILDQHKRDSHTPVVCIECGKTYQNKHSLRQHEQGHRMKMVCSDCGRSYKNRSTFNRHINLKICQQQERKLNSDAQFVCDYCKKRFSHKSSLRGHIQFEHGNAKSHTCMWCSKKFNSQSRLQAHIVKHTQEKKFTCDVCGGKFVSKTSLLYHTRIHTGEKPYQCKFCDRNFISASRRTGHVKRHHIVTMHECDICHSKFKDSSSFSKHRRRHFNPKSKLHCFK